MSRKGYEVFSSNKCGVIIVNCGWDEVEQNNYGFLSECKINADGKIVYYGIHSGL